MRLRKGAWSPDEESAPNPPPPRPVRPAPIPPPPSTTDYLHDIHGELVEMRKLQERIADALERMVAEAEGYRG